MPYEINTNRASSSRIRQEVGLQTSGRSQGTEATLPHYKFYELEPAQVISVDITNKDATQIGVAQVRPLYSCATVPEKELPLAWPLDSNVKSYPLKNEVVIVVEYNGRMYYSQRLNFFNFTNNNITKDPYSYLTQDAQDKQDYAQASAGNPNASGGATDASKAGKYFTINSKVQPLLPLEGDIIYEGRFGNSLRFGGTIDPSIVGIDNRFKSTWAIGEKVGSPIIIIRNGQRLGGDQKTAYVEDINKDAASIYLTSDQIVPFQPSSRQQQTYRGTYPSVWDGPQVLISSDRVAINAKKDGVYIISPKTIGISTNGTFNVDATNLVIFNSSRINLGLNASQPAVKGYEWVKIMIKLLTALSTETHPTPAGTSGFPGNSKVYTDLMDELQAALSGVTFTE